MTKATRLSMSGAEASISLGEALVAAGMNPALASKLEALPQRVVEIDPRRPWREPGHARDEVIFVQSGMLSKFKAEAGGRRQIVALRFAGEGIMPQEGVADYGIQAIVKSRVLVGRADDFFDIIDRNPDMARFFRQLIQRHEAIGYEWLVNCGRRDSTARVAHLLCETAARIGIDVEREPMANPFTQQQIAEITGQTSVNVNRVFAELERQGLIRRVGKSIHFSDWSEIRRVAGFQPAYLQ